MDILSTTAGGVVKGVDWIEYGLDKELVKLGHSVDSFSSISVRKIFPQAKAEETIDRIRIRRFRPLSPFSLLAMLKGNWDVIHSNHLGYLAPISSYAALRKKIKDVPLVFTVHGIYHDPFIVKDVQDPFSHPVNYKIVRSFNPLRPDNWFTHLPLFMADKVTALTYWEKAELTKFGVPEEKIEVAPNGIDLTKYAKVKSGKRFVEKYDISGQILLFMGQTIRRKGPEYLLQALQQLINTFEDLSCVFVGYRKNESLEILCDTLGIREHVRFLGFLSEKEKVEALRAADVFVFPTLYEGFGTVLLEAMAAGCPIVTTRVAGIPEIIEHGENGLLVSPKDPEGLAQTITTLLHDKRLRTSVAAKGLKRVKAYNWPEVAKRYLEIFESAIKS